MYFLLGTCILLTCSSGIVTAIIVKKLDNIVKIYTQGLTNMLTSVACTVFFPSDFHLNTLFTLCLALMVIAIFMYENQNINLKAVMEYCKDRNHRLNVLFVSVATLCFVLICLVLTNYRDLSSQGDNRGKP